VKDIHDKVLGEPLVSRVLSSGTKVYLVGGYLRDIFRGAESKDIDFVVEGNLESLLKRISPEIGGSVVKFRKAPLLRVVAGDYTLDFTELKGAIEEDLSQRDFTVNAIAWSENEGVVDPFGGVSDIHGKRIRALSERNFLADPLRLVRAYRFSGEFGWDLEPGTRKTIRKLKDLIRYPATERITLEMFKLLNSSNSISCLKALRIAERDGILDEIIVIDNGLLKRNIKALSRFNVFLNKIPQEESVSLGQPFSQGLSYGGLLRAEMLLNGSCLEKNRLNMSRVILKRVKMTSGLMGKLEEGKRIDNKSAFALFSRAGEAAKDLAFLTMRRGLLTKARRFMMSKPPLNAEKIMEITRIGPGPELGGVLEELRERWFLGEIKDERDAMAWLAGRFLTNLQ